MNNSPISIKHGGIEKSGPRCEGVMRMSNDGYAAFDMMPPLYPYDLKCDKCGRLIYLCHGDPAYEPKKDNIPCVWQSENE